MAKSEVIESVLQEIDNVSAVYKGMEDVEIMIAKAKRQGATEALETLHKRIRNMPVVAEVEQTVNKITVKEKVGGKDIDKVVED